MTRGPRRVAIVGFGKLGRSCARAILADEELALAGIVRRADSVREPLAEPFARTPCVNHIRELTEVEAALVCVPPPCSLAAVRDALQARIGVVECAVLHGDAFVHYEEEIHRVAARRKVPAIVGAGWDPGALSLFRGLFALLCPKGHTRITRRSGVNLHHTTVARAVPGVRAALATETRDRDGKAQRYVYVELEPGADSPSVERAIRNDPLYAGEETQVFPVPDIGRLEAESGVLLERQGSAAPHAQLLLEARFAEPALSAAVMLAAAHALAHCEPRAYNLFELPLDLLWRSRRLEMVHEWL